MGEEGGKGECFACELGKTEAERLERELGDRKEELWSEGA
jgi:hypothetical protein